MRFRLLRKTVDDVMDALDVPQEVKITSNQISEGLCTRDKFFHSCWLRMKQLHPDRIQEMGEIELYIAGLDTSIEEETEEDEEETRGTII